MIQGTDEWLTARAGRITASRIADMMAGGTGVTKSKYMVQLAVERMTGKPVSSGFISQSMKDGTINEPLAREHYEFENDVKVTTVGLVQHPNLLNAAASPDGLVGVDGLLEIKCPDLSTHANYLLTKKIPTNYILQMQWQMACTGRAWCDWMTFAIAMPVKARALVIRVQRDEKKIQEIELAAIEFDDQVSDLINKILGD